jgi:hypothetical protein
LPDLASNHVGYWNNRTITPVVWPWPDVRKGGELRGPHFLAHRRLEGVDDAFLPAREVNVQHLVGNQMMRTRLRQRDDPVTDAGIANGSLTKPRSPKQTIESVHMSLERAYLRQCSVELSMNVRRGSEVLENKVFAVTEILPSYTQLTIKVR